MDETLEGLIVKFSANKLNQFTGRIQDCLGRLTYEQIWARGSEDENAIGNLVLHLAGNVRQWIGTGMAGKPDVRARDREFAARGDVQAGELGERLSGVVADAVATIEKMTGAELLERITVQKYELTKLEALLHVVEHFAQHTAQIIFATKLLTSSDLGYYKHLSAPAHKEKTP